MRRTPKVFIVVDSTSLRQDAILQQALADLYAEVYSAPPWNEDWNRESALAELDEVMAEPGFVGTLYIEDSLIGFSWSYAIPEGNSSRVDFTRIRAELNREGIDPRLTLYEAENGVKREFRRKGICSLLIREKLRAQPDWDFLAYRTKNQAMVEVYRSLFGGELFSFAEESSYGGGKVYVNRVG